LTIFPLGPTTRASGFQPAADLVNVLTDNTHALGDLVVIHRPGGRENDLQNAFGVGVHVLPWQPVTDEGVLH